MAFVLFNLAAVAALIGIDQLIKLWAVQVLQPVGAMPLIPRVVELRFLLNPGMAFSLLSGKQLFLITATSVALLAQGPVAELGWHIVAREPVALAFADARKAMQVAIMLGLAAAFLAALTFCSTEMSAGRAPCCISSAMAWRT